MSAKFRRSRFLLAAAMACGMGILALPAFAQEEEEFSEIEGDPNDPEAQMAAEEAAGGPTTGEADSSANVEATVADIESLISLPSSAQLGRESDEAMDKPVNLFESPEVMRTLLGNKPRYVYFPEGTDPMIIPWVRNQVVAAELLADAMQVFKRAQTDGNVKDAQRAADLFASIIERYKETPQVADAKKYLDEVNVWISVQTMPTPPGGDKGKEPVPPGGTLITLPPWVQSNTRGIIHDTENPEGSRVLVGNYILKAGDTLERFPAVSIKEIGQAQVVYSYSGKEFLVAVKSD